MPSGFLGRGIGPTAIARRAAATFDWWTVAGQTCVAAYKAVGQVDLATSYVNLANPGTYNAAPGAAPGLAAGGWVFAGNPYLTIAARPDKTWSVILRFSNHTGGNASFLIGNYAGSDANYGFYFFENTLYFVNRDEKSMTVGTSGIVALAGLKSYLDGAPTGLPDNSGIVGTVSAAGLGIGADPTGQFRLLGTIAAVGIYSTTLSAADVAALSARMAALA